jgi:ankyrin repeat protein
VGQDTSNEVNIAAQLLSAGANVEAGLDTTPLREAAYPGNLAMLRLLLAHGANPHAVRGSFSANQLASMNRQYEAMQIMSESRAKAKGPAK